jgi:hypothetical protein
MKKKINPTPAHDKPLARRVRAAEAQARRLRATLNKIMRLHKSIIAVAEDVLADAK